MSNYTPTLTASAGSTKDSTHATILANELGTEFDNIQTAVNSKKDSSAIEAVATGGTGASTAATARSNLGAAASGANTDITSIALAGLCDLSNAAAGQIKFPATQNASVDVNTLDDYKEGTFTPTIASTSGSITSYTVTSATYTKIGRLVFVDCGFNITNGGTGSGSLTVSGLPYTSGSNGPIATGRETNSTNKVIAGVVNTTQILQVAFYDNTYCGTTGYVLRLSFSYYV